MKWRSFPQWLGASVWSCALAAGCSHNEAPMPVAAVVRPTPAIVTVTTEPRATAAPVVMAPEMPAPTPASRAQGSSVQPVSYTSAAPPKDASAATVRADTKESKPAFPRGEATPMRKASVDITTAACCQHADDYSALVGAVEYSRLSNGWRLRYAGLDEADSYGGSVTLTGNIPLTGLKDGQHVRVKGHLQNPDDHSTSPAYHVDSFEVLKGPQ